MDQDGYRGGPTSGGKWGCATAALVGAPIFFFLMIGDALGDCVPDVDCHKGVLRNVALPTGVIALAIGLAVRALVNRLVRDRD